MSQDQLKALLQALTDSEELRQKMQAAADLDAAQAIANEAGFLVSKQDWLDYQSSQAEELDDAALEQAVGGLIQININLNIYKINNDGTFKCVNSPEA